MKNTIFLIALFSVSKVFAQENLYFIMAHPFRNISTQFPGIIYQFDDDSLIHKLKFSDKEILLEYVRYYPELDYVSVVTADHKKADNPRTFKRVFVNQLDTIYEWKIDFGNGFGSNCLKEVLIQFKNQEIFDCFSCRNEDTNEGKFFGINIYTGDRREIFPHEFEKAIISGSPGAAIEGGDYMNLYSSTENGKLVIPKTQKIEDRPPYPVAIPDSLQIEAKRILSLDYNGKSGVVISYGNEEADSMTIGSIHFLILSKTTQEWHRLTMPGRNTAIKGFADWVSGNISTLNIKRIRDDRGRLKEKVHLGRISPGKERRRTKGTNTGTPFDFRADFFDLYYPGILFLHNIDTRETIRWSTGQGDSEILLVESEVVYYRINDEIYKAPILNGKVLGKSELLIKNEIVPDIHWAFISSVK